MIKYPIPIIILVLIPFFIIPVSAVDFNNPGFETGTINSTTDWTWIPQGSSSYSVSGDYKAAGSYGIQLYAQYTGGLNKATIKQSIDTTGYDYINFDYWLQDGSNGWMIVLNGFTTLGSTGTRHGEWKAWSQNVAAYGVLDFRVQAHTSSGLGLNYLWLDNFELSNTPRTDPILTPNAINYNPDIPISNVKPFNLSYTLNATYSNNPLYPCFIYSWVGTDIGNETHPNIIWGSKYEGYVNQESGYFITSDYFHSYNWPDLNESYGVVLYNPDGMTQGIRFDNIESDPNMLDYDQIYVNYSYNKTPPSYPTPQPTPNMTAIPTPSGTPTPQPTATPQPNPESINESLNTSFKQGYSNLVNTTIDGFYEPVYNFTYYIVSPLLGINDTLYDFSIHMNESFTNSSSSLVLSSSILFLIMTNIPDKLINVMTYYLIWLIVLLIFKGDA